MLKWFFRCFACVRKRKTESVAVTEKDDEVQFDVLNRQRDVAKPTVVAVDEKKKDDAHFGVLVCRPAAAYTPPSVQPSAINELNRDTHTAAVLLPRDSVLFDRNAYTSTIVPRSYTDEAGLDASTSTSTSTLTLPSDTNELCSEVWNDDDFKEQFVSGFNIDITRRDLHTLRDGAWLNDEVVNFFFELIVQRSEVEPDFPKVYSFNTFFFDTLAKRGYMGVKRWTKNVNLFEYDLIMVPIHKGIHWCLAMIDVRNFELRYFDSMGSKGRPELLTLLDYLRQESEDKHESVYRIRDYNFKKVEPCPRQENGNDCGVFMCRMGECASRDAPFDFSQRHIPYFRRRMVYEIVNKCLL